VSRLSNTYFRGLNYLLNEQQDKAIEIFLQIAEVDKDTVETQFALGICSAVAARWIERSACIRAGRAQRAERRAKDPRGARAWRGLHARRFARPCRTLFTDLVQMGVHAPQALRQLIAIYQFERDWYKAIEHAVQYEKTSGEPMGKVIAHFHCELAEKARLENKTGLAREEISNAYAADSHSVRAGVLEGRLELAEGNDGAAIRAFERVARHDIEFLPEILTPLLACYERRGETARARGFLQEMIEHYPGVSPVLALAQLIQRDEGIASAQAFLARQVQQRPSVRGEAALIDLSLENQATTQASRCEP